MFRTNLLRIGAAAATLLLALPLSGGDGPDRGDLPRPPAIDMDTLPVAEVLEVRAGNELVVRIGDQPTTVRLIGTYIPGRGPDADAARAFVARMLAGEAVCLANEPGWPDEDGKPHWRHAYRYPDGLFVNLELIRQGYARFSAGARSEHEELLRAYERLARRLDKGLWAPARATPASQPAAAPHAAAAEPDTPAAEEARARDAEAGGPQVYVTPHGRKYHRADCQYVRNGAKALSLAEAQALGYTPCSRCKPPQ
jgi:endonuclease YncB( thermonuclease family)